MIKAIWIKVVKETTGTKATAIVQVETIGSKTVLGEAIGSKSVLKEAILMSEATSIRS